MQGGGGMEWSESICKAIDYIESHITEELTIADIAKQAVISPYYFQKGFSMLCGCGKRACFHRQENH